MKIFQITRNGCLYIDIPGLGLQFYSYSYSRLFVFSLSLPMGLISLDTRYDRITIQISPKD